MYYKPAYGAALMEDLIKYDFWGYCDVDLIFGDLKIFITDDILDRNDRIYNLDHFTLFRNIDRMNNFYKIEPNLKIVFLISLLILRRFLQRMMKLEQSMDMV